MIRGTTPTHIFAVDQINTSQIRELRITYQQMGRTLLEKTKKDVKMDEHSIEFTLTQEETFKFRAGYDISIQVKVLLLDGSVLASPIASVGIEKILNTEVLG